MKALVIVAHGSRLPEGNELVRRLASRVRRQASGRFVHVTSAFIEHGTPTTAEAIEQCIGLGAREVLVLPYLLAPGKHLNDDIPAAVQSRQKAHPDVLMRTAPCVGCAEGMARLLLELVGVPPSVDDL